MQKSLSSSLSASIVRVRLTVLRVGFRFRLALSRVRTPAPSRLLLALLAGSGVSAFALPQGGQVVSGNVSINAPSNGSMNIVQTTDKGIVDWQSFNVGTGEKVNFQQPGAGSSTLNRIVGNDASSIFGQINANGQVFLINPNGVLFAPGASVNASGLVASTLQLQDADYLAGRYVFSDAHGGKVDNQGVIHAGFAVLAGAQVSNTGSIVANGTAALLAGDRVTMNLTGSDVLSVSVDAPTVAALVHAGGIVQADGGQVLVSAKAAGALLDTVVNVDGLVQARSIGTRNGTIVLDGGGAGTVDVSGRLDASGLGAGQTGGTVKALGAQVGLFGQASIDVSGDAGGGVVRVGGDWHGAGPDANASQVFVGSGATIAANAMGSGNGGDVVLWSDDKTQFFGSIAARGGARGGHGGAVETSAEHELQVAGVVDGSARHGTSGYWLLDPDNLLISDAGPTSNVTESGDVWTTRNRNATLKASDLNQSITSGTSVEVRTGNTGGNNGNGDITVTGSIVPALAAGQTASLTLNARGNILFQDGGNITAPAGTGLDVTLNTAQNVDFNQPGSRITSTVRMDAGTRIDTGSGDLTIDAPGTGTQKAVTIQFAELDVGGVVDLHTFGGSVTQVAPLHVGGLVVNTGAGNTTLANAANTIAQLTATTTGSGKVALATAGDLQLNSITAAGLTINTAPGNGDITQGPGTHLAIGPSGLDVTTGHGDATLTAPGNSVGLFRANSTSTDADAVHLITDTALALGNMDAINVTVATTNDNVLTAANSAVNVSGLLAVDAGTGTIQVGGADSAIRGFAGHSSSTAADAVRVGTKTDLALGDVSAVNLLVDSSGHAVTQAAGTDLTIGGLMTITAGAGAVDVGSATSTVHGFTASSTSTAGDGVRLTTGSDVVLGDLDAVNASVATNGHAVSQAAGTDIQVTGALSISSGVGNVVVGSAHSVVGRFDTDADVSRQVALTTGSDVALGDIAASGLTVTTSGHNVTQAAGTGLTVANDLDLVTGAGSADVGSATSSVGHLLATSTNTGTGIKLTTGSSVALGDMTVANATIAIDPAATANVVQDENTTLAVSGTLKIVDNLGTINVGSADSHVARFDATSQSTAVDAVKLTVGADSGVGNVSAVNFTVDTNGHNLTQATGTGVAVGGALAIDAGTTGNVTLVAAGDLALGHVAAHDASVDAATHAVTQAAGTDLAVGGTLTLRSGTTGTVRVGSAGSAVGTLAAASTGTAADAVSLATGADLALGNVNAVNVSVATNGRAVSQAGGTHLAVGGTLSVDSGAGAVNIGNAASSVVRFQGGTDPTRDVALTTGSDVALGAIGARNLTVTTSGHDLTQAAGTDLTVAGTLDVVTGAGSAAVGSAASSVQRLDASSTNAAAGVRLDTATAVQLGDLSVANATVQVHGANAADGIAQATGTHLAATGLLTLVTDQGTIAAGSNDSTVAGFAASSNATAAGAVALTTGAAVALADITASNLTVTSNGHDVTQAADTALHIGGTLDVQAGAGRIVVGNGDSAVGTFVGASTSTAATGVQLTTGSAVVLGGLDAVNASIVSNGHDVTQSGAVDVTGTLNVVAGAGAIHLDAPTNVVGTFAAASSAGDAVTLQTGSAVALGDVNATGLAVTSNGHDITQAAGTDLGVGTLTLDAGAGAIAVGSAGSAVGLFNAASTGAAGVRLDTGSDVTLGAITGTPTLALDAHGHAITQSGGTDLHLGSLSASGSSVAVGSAGSTIGVFSGSVSGAATVQTGADLQLGDVSAGTLAVQTNGHALTQVADTDLAVSGGATLDGGVVAVGSAGSHVGRLDGSATSLDVTTGSALQLGNVNTTSLTVDTHAGNGAVTQADGTGVIATGASFTTGTGDLTLASQANAIGGLAASSHAVRLVDTTGVALGPVTAASLSVDTSAGNGAITQGGVLTVSGATTLASGSGGVALTLANHLASLGVNGAGAVAVTNAGPLVLDDVTAGALTLSTAGAVTQAQDATIAVTGTTTVDATSTGDVTLDHAANDFGGAVSVNGNAVSLRDANDLTVAALTSNRDTGGISLVAAGTLATQPGAIDAGAGDLTLSSGSALATSGTLSGRAITLNGSSVTFGDDVHATGALSVTTSRDGAITQAGGVIQVGGATLLAAGAGSVSLAAGPNVFAEPVTASGGSVALSGAGDLVAHVSATSGDASLAATGALAVDGSAAGTFHAHGGSVSLGTLQGAGADVVAATGDITQDGDLTISGASGFAAGGHDVALTRTTNHFVGDVTASGANVSLADDTALTAHLAAGGDATLHAAGALSVDGSIGGALVAQGDGIGQAGALSVGGTAQLAGGARGVSLGAAGNDFGGLVSVSTGPAAIADVDGLSVQLDDVSSATLTAGGPLTVSGNTSGALVAAGNGIVFGATDVGGTLAVAGGNGTVSQTGDLHVTGASSLDAGTGTLTLVNAGNRFGGDVTLAGANVNVGQSGALAAHLANAGNASVSSGGGALAIDGSATGDVAVSGTSVTLGATRAGGSLSAIATEGTISQGGDLEVGGAGHFDAGTHDVTLARAGNTFGGTVTATGADVSLQAAGALSAQLQASADATLGAAGALAVGGTVGGKLSATGQSVTFAAGGTTVAGDLVVTTTGLPRAAAAQAGQAAPQAVSAGGIGQAGVLEVAGATTLDAGNGDVVLDNGGNALAGAITARGHGLAIANGLATNAQLDASGDVALTTPASLQVQGHIGGGLSATGGDVLVGVGDPASPMNLGGAFTANATAGNVQLGYIGAHGANVTATGEVLLDGRLASDAGIDITGASIRGLNRQGSIDVTSGGVPVRLVATAGNIGRTPGSVAGQLDPAGAITLEGLAGQDGGVISVDFPLGDSAWFGVTNRDDFQRLNILENGALNSQTFGCDLLSCFNVLGETGALADSVISNILNAASQDSQDAAFGTENLDLAMRKGYVTTIGRVPPGIDEIDGDLGSTACEPRVTSGRSIRSSKACSVDAPDKTR